MIGTQQAIGDKLKCASMDDFAKEAQLHNIIDQTCRVPSHLIASGKMQVSSYGQGSSSPFLGAGSIRIWPCTASTSLRSRDSPPTCTVDY